MDFHGELEERVRRRGVREESRLEILERIRGGAGGLGALDARRAELLERVEAAARRLLEEASGR